MKHSRIRVALLVGILLAGTASIAAADIWGVQEFKVPIKAPDFTLKDLNGRSITLSRLQGKIVMLNFFTTW